MGRAAATMARLGGMLFLITGATQFLIYTVPPSLIPAGIRSLLMAYLMTGLPLLVLAGVWLWRDPSLPPDNHVHDLLLAVAGTVIFLTGALTVAGPVTRQTLTEPSLLGVGALLAGIVGMAGRLLLAYAGFCLLQQPGRKDGDKHWAAMYRIYLVGGVAVAFFLLMAGIQVLIQISAWLDLAPVPRALLVLGWIFGTVFLRLFTVQTHTVLHRDSTDQETLFDLFGGTDSPLIGVIAGTGAADTHKDDDAVIVTPDSRLMADRAELRTIAEDPPGFRAYRFLVDGTVLSRWELAFRDHGDGADVRIDETVERRLSLYSLVSMLVTSIYTTLFLEGKGFAIEASEWRAGVTMQEAWSSQQAEDWPEQEE